MALYITGDTHGDFRRFLPEQFPEQGRLTKEDMVLICGDFGGVWYGDRRDGEGLDFLGARPFTALFVTGNHENYDALNAHPLEQWHGGTIRRIRPTVLLLERGQVFDLGGKRIFTMGERAAMTSRTGSWSRAICCLMRSSGAYKPEARPFGWTIAPGGRRNCSPRRNTGRPGQIWIGWGGGWSTSSPAVPPPAFRTNCCGAGPPRMPSRTFWRRSGSGASPDIGSSGITMIMGSSGSDLSCCMRR